MGSYLDKPETTKKSTFDENEFLEVGSSSMQGWRINQEDAHNSILNINGDNVSFFGLYDGHGGSEVAEYCSQKLPEFLKQLKSFKDKNYEEALKEAFMGFDASLLLEDVVEELKQMAKNNPDYDDDEMDDAEDEETAEEIINLHEEARMSLSEVLQKYKNGTELTKTINAQKVAKQQSSSEVGPATSISSQDPSSSSSKQIAKSKETEKTTAASSAASNSENQVSSSSSSLEQNPSPTSTQQIDEKVDDNEPQSSSVSAGISEQLNGQIGSSSSSNANANSSSTSAETAEAAVACAPESSSSASEPEKAKSTSKPNSNEDESTEDDDDDDEHDETYKESPKKKKVSNSDDSSDDEEAYTGDEDLDEEELDDEEISGEEEEDEDQLDDAFMNNMETGPGKQSGCTAVVAILDGRDLYVANAGDSRCVLCRNGKVVEMTADHKPEDDPEFQRIRKAGGRVTMDGRVNGGLNLSRAIGDHGYKMNKDLPPEEQMITAMPDLKKIVLEPEDDFMVLACDGIWNYMSNEEVIGFIKHRIDSNKPLTEICEELFDNCLAPDTLGDGTGCDNMTAIIVKFKDTIFKQPDSRSSACNSETEIPSRKRSLNIDNENECELKSSEPCDKKQRIEDELAPSTVDTS